MSARVKLPDPLDKLLRSQLERAIEEAALYTDDELIARRRIIDKWNQIDVAAELGWYRSTVSDHEKYIFQRVKDVANSFTKIREPGIDPAPIFYTRRHSSKKALSKISTSSEQFLSLVIFCPFTPTTTVIFPIVFRISSAGI